MARKILNLYNFRNTFQGSLPFLESSFLVLQLNALLFMLLLKEDSGNSSILSNPPRFFCEA